MRHAILCQQLAICHPDAAKPLPAASYLSIPPDAAKRKPQTEEELRGVLASVERIVAKRGKPDA